ncbi:hypothetical protein RvY_13286 [Ramazzottius varieornatus]|uniref:Uncharacterized protein n=1 Tax=Ramazzottius varieornatus TaxID=947166 RepID=A0A1D1VMB5_RAMVA|nr:hypothetical protein RvY_13286 [Ramazzottius varieornatus]
MIDQRISVMNRNGSCVGRYVLMLGRLDGVATFYLVQTDTTANPSPHQLYQLYMDPSTPDGMAIQYECVKGNFKTGIKPRSSSTFGRTQTRCPLPRRRPRTKIINDTLNPYCLSTADLPLVTFDSDLDTCRPPRSEIYENMIAGFKSALPVRAWGSS